MLLNQTEVEMVKKAMSSVSVGAQMRTRPTGLFTLTGSW